ncbi:MAG: FAD-dependent oxidoreductase [Dysgonamonadaceae bacterium]|jgi:NADPH-dependent 2,4-dienoyl-CoA reductase/sulfur reductase-like enzyme/peroxiredoxin family protein/rhodanese-related sulfurtransferase/TusA-related sulfurtransferase|nr:FAD-dependent oxidoreductase [Dysgonamonadaceae bacterium]
MKHIIVGGVAGGATAAARIRRVDEFAEIILLEKGKYISYANCGLPYYIGGTISDREELFLQTPESFKARFNIDVRVENTAIGIDTVEKTVTIRRADGSVYTETYDKLLLSPGVSPFKPPLEGIDSEGIFALHNVADTDRIKNYLDTHKVQKAVVVGGGFIGIEMTENLHNTGIEVAIVEMANQVITPIDFSMAAQVHHYLSEKGVNLYLEQTVERFESKDGIINVCLKSGTIIPADMVILSIGVRPETSLAKNAGLKIGETGGIWVNEFLETSTKDVYAIGDAIEFPHPLTGKPWLNYLANPANRQGRLVADNMTKGNTEKYEGAIGTSIVKIFDLTVAATGLPAKKLLQLNIPYQSSFTHSSSHAGYYPGSTQMTIKLTFDPKSGKLYGAQGIGYDGVDKRIDQIALLIKQGGSVFDLMKVEHCYAPPYSSAKDPIAIAGYTAGNIVTGRISVVHWREIQAANPDEVTILDVRTKEETEGGRIIQNTLNIPLDELRERLDEIPKNKLIYVHCAIGLRGYLATQILIQRGFANVKNISGGYKTYSAAITPVNPEGKKQQETKIAYSNAQTMKTIKIDAGGLQCPGPILKLKKTIDEIAEGDRVEINATDAAFPIDAESWCKSTGNILISETSDKGQFTVVVEKKSSKNQVVTSSRGNNKTLIMFSDDLDRALATFVLANGAAATGKKVSIFFTFWGLNVIKKVNKPRVKKDIFGRMFSMMLPSHTLKLKLSKWNMFGIGAKMMRHIMKVKNIESLKSLRTQAIEQGVEFIGCQMSMDVMGVKKEELLDNVVIGGVATYMERAENANVNLFI